MTSGDLAKLDFSAEGAAAPDTVNPSLWRQSHLINIGGLFEVADGIYRAAQVVSRRE